MKKKIKIAIIGSRDTDNEIMENMFHTLNNIISLCKKCNTNLELRSGGALKGPDDLIRLLALKPNLFNESIYAKVYIPNKRKLYSVQNYPKEFVKFIVPDVTDEIRELINELHPYPKSLTKDWLYEYHGRNLHIIAGDNLDDPVDCVYYSGVPIGNIRIKGGTGIGVAYANKLNIPTFNEYTSHMLETTNYVHDKILFKKFIKSLILSPC